mmetsp:Transcript_18864/g.33253  ORF Transcript_18864/g.33253 Transcript_18864/m.33253 type:complete len:279 (-) Transcript_18864:74-910(-)
MALSSSSRGSRTSVFSLFLLANTMACLVFLPSASSFVTPSLSTTRPRESTLASLKRTNQLPILFSSSEAASDTIPSTSPKKNAINGATPEQASFPSQLSVKMTNWLGRIRKVSNFASFLCVLDCTILPVITVALPLLGVFNLGASQLEALHQLGHSLALYFVLPVGSLTTVINYISHRKTSIAAMATVGLFLVGLANSHIHIFHGTMIGQALHMIQHCGPWHRVVNISGCALLLGSNYLSQQQGCAHHDHHSHDGDCHGTSSSPCSHNHSHEEHDHDH